MVSTVYFGITVLVYLFDLDWFYISMSNRVRADFIIDYQFPLVNKLVLFKQNNLLILTFLGCWSWQQFWGTVGVFDGIESSLFVMSLYSLFLLWLSFGCFVYLNLQFWQIPEIKQRPLWLWYLTLISSSASIGLFKWFF